jgi:hypothetical protein
VESIASKSSVCVFVISLSEEIKLLIKNKNKNLFPRKYVIRLNHGYEEAPIFIFYVMTLCICVRTWVPQR